MVKKPAPKPAADRSDPRVVPILAAFSHTPGFTVMESRSRAMRGLMLHGKSFGMSSHGRFILRLTPERASELIEAGLGQPFCPSPGRVMKGWIEVTAPTRKWLALAKEAQQLAAAAPAPRARSGARKAAGRRAKKRAGR